MRRHSEYFELVLVAFGAACFFVFNSLFGGLFYTWTMQQLELHLGLTEAEVIARLSQNSFAIMATVLLIWGLYRFLKRELTREFKDETARLRVELADLRTEGVTLRNRGQSLRIGIPEWIAECIDWTDRVIGTITEISPADAEWYKTFDAVPPPRIPLKGSYNLAQIKAGARLLSR